MAPRIVKKVEATVQSDVKPTVRVLGHVMNELFFKTWPGPPLPNQEEASSRPSPSPSPSPSRPLFASAKGMEIRVVPSDFTRPPSQQAQEVLDAEWTEDGNSPICETCGGTGRLGRPGYEISCPACQ